MLEAALLSEAFTTTLIPTDTDAELRHRRREKYAPQPKTRPHLESKGVRRPEKPARKVSWYDMECGTPPTSADEAGPRCPRTKKGVDNGPAQTCPHCLQVIGLADPDAYDTSGKMLPGFGFEDPYEELPVHPLVDEMRPVYYKDDETRHVSPRSTQSVRSNQKSVQQNLVDGAQRVKPEIVYAILIVLGLLLITQMETRGSSRTRYD